MARHKSFSSLDVGETFRYQGREYKKVNGDIAADCRYPDDTVTYPIHSETRVEAGSEEPESASPDKETKAEKREYTHRKHKSPA